MKRHNIETIFQNEYVMLVALALSVLFGLASIVLMVVYNDMTLMVLFEKIVKIVVSIFLYKAFSRLHLDAVRGMVGGILFCLLYQEAFLVLGTLWGETANFDRYLIMGVQGSLYLAAESASFMMTIFLTVNHYVIEFSRFGNYRNVIFSKIIAMFKILVYIALMIINGLLELETTSLVISGLEFSADFLLIISLICVESQLDYFKEMRKELIDERKMLQHE